MDKLFVVMPAYNEEANIKLVIEQWHPIVERIGNGSLLIIVNDGSKDSTFLSMQELSNNYSCFKPLNKKNSGHGPTCIYAYKYALQKHADFIFQTDSDGQTNPEEFWQFWNERNQYDFIIGTRKGRQDGFSRIFVTKILKIFLWIIFGVMVEDSNTPFRLMRANKLKGILNVVPEDFFLSNILISTIIVKWKERVKWIPITFKPRQGGVNSVNFKRILQIGIKAVKDFKKIKKEIAKNEK